MKVSDIPFNMEHSINDDLYEVPKDIEQMKQGVDWLIGELENISDEDKRGQVCSMIGVYARIIQDYESSEKYLKQALDTFRDSGRSMLINYVKSRLATTYYCNYKYGPADELFEEVVKFLREFNDTKKGQKVHIYCLEHYARSKYIRKFYKDALYFFTEAHELEMIHGDLEHMNSLSEYMQMTKETIDREAEESEAKAKERAEMEENYKNHKD